MPEEEAEEEPATLFQVPSELSTGSTAPPPIPSDMETAMAGAAVVNSLDGADASNTDGNSEKTAECDIGVEPGTPVPPSRADEGSQDSKSVALR